MSLNAAWSGSDLQGTAIFDGATYTNVGNLIAGSPEGSVAFSGAVAAPSSSGLTGTVSAPFNFVGRFQFPQSGGSAATTATLFGSGTASVEFFRISTDVPWSYRSAVYQFSDVDPVPEPGTMILVGTAMVGLGLRRRSCGKGSGHMAS